MLVAGPDIFSNYFDSSFIMRGKAKSDPRLVTDYELELFSDDQGISVVDGVPHPVRRGMLLCARPGQLRYSHLPVKCHYIRLFAPETAEACALFRLPTALYLPEAALSALLPLFTQMTHCFLSQMSPSLRDMKVNALFWEIMFQVYQSLPDPQDPLPNRDNETLNTVRQYLDTHVSKPCSLEELGRLVHLSPNYLHKLFRTAYGMTPYDYLCDRRIEVAKHLMSDGRHSLLEISLELGFSSQSHFGRVFKSRTGQTPAAFRKEMAQKYRDNSNPSPSHETS